MQALLWTVCVVSISSAGCSSPSDGATSPTSGGGGQTNAEGATLAGAAGSAPGGAAGSAPGGAAGVVQGGNAGSITNAGAGAGGMPSGGSEGGGAAGTAGASGGSAPTFTYDPTEDAKFDELPLYDGEPPNFKAGAPAETLEANGHIGNVSVPTLRRYAMDGSKATGFGYLVFPGGGYSILDIETHAGKLAERLGPLGIAVFSLKYRVGSGTTDAPRDALIDAKRAIRIVKLNASHWAVEPKHLGVIGYSAGSHLALNLAANFDAGNAASGDPIEKLSSRPAFVGSMSTWSFGSSTSPFTFPADVPPAFFCHAQDDTTAPIALPKAVELQIKAKGAATLLDFYATGGHSTCHPGDPTMAGHDWPNKFWPWVQAAVP